MEERVKLYRYDMTIWIRAGKTMAKVEPFEEYASQYEDCFERNRFVYKSELRAIREQLPESGNSRLTNFKYRL